MAMKTPTRSPRTVTPAAFAKMEASLENCTEEVEKLKREIAINVRRMGAMQAEIDHLRSLIRN